MWPLLAFLLLMLFFALWLRYATETEGTSQDMNPPNHGSSSSESKSQAAELPTPDGARRSIAYEVTRWDLFQNLTTFMLRNRAFQAVILLGIVAVAALILNGYSGAPLAFLLNACFGAICGLLGCLAVALPLVSLAMAFGFKQRGVVGQHTLEITERGLSERTEYNESLARWASVRRIHSTRRYLYIYVGDFNLHSVPKRCFAREQIAGFEAELRAFAKRGRQAPTAG